MHLDRFLYMHVFSHFLFAFIPLRIHPFTKNIQQSCDLFLRKGIPGKNKILNKTHINFFKRINEVYYLLKFCILFLIKTILCLRKENS